MVFSTLHWENSPYNDIITELQKQEEKMQITKRDGQLQLFNENKIVAAIEKSFKAVGNEDPVPDSLIDSIVLLIEEQETPSVEFIQDTVERALMEFNYLAEAKAYILYREKRARARGRILPEEVKKAFATSSGFFKTPLQQWQFFDKYARYDWGTGRRETWVETVDRVVSFLSELSNNKLGKEIYEIIHESILNMDVMPSMRLVASAGPTARRNNIAIYNCSFLPVDSIDAFVEALIISMNGCGVGYSVESYHVNKLPKIKRFTGKKIPIFVVPDTTDGWADALRIGIETWISGYDIEFDTTKIRPSGSVLKTKGGTASGPDPLVKMLSNIRKIIIGNERLTTLDAHDIMCHVGSAAVAGGSRRTAMIALFDYNDQLMIDCKKGDMVGKEHRFNANNSAVWDKPMSFEQVFDFMSDVFIGNRGEPGIFSRFAAKKTLPERRKFSEWMGTNPCGEIILHPNQFCNLSIAVARPGDTEEALARKVGVATIIGTIQSSATHFPGLRPIWKENAEKERLLGVDITGQMDCPALRNPETLQHLRDLAISTNELVADALGINRSAAITCVKPSGNSSVLLDTSSGMHPRYAQYYIRNVRTSNNNPMAKVLLEQGVPVEPLKSDPVRTMIVPFPVKSPDHSVVNISAIELMSYWLMVKRNYTEHNPSVTIIYRPEEVFDIIKWVYENQEWIGGMTFYPYDGALYDQPPIVPITKEEYEVALSNFPEIDFSLLYKYEDYDTTTSFKELACFAGHCEI